MGKIICSLCGEEMKPDSGGWAVDKKICDNCIKFLDKVADRCPDEVVDLLVRQITETSKGSPMIGRFHKHWLEKYLKFCKDPVLRGRGERLLRAEASNGVDYV